MKKAFTLIEVVMAMAILVIGILGVVRFLPVGLRASKSSEMMSKAAFLAQEKLEKLKLVGFEELSAPVPSVALEGEEGAYSWQVQVSEVSLEGISSSEDVRKLSLTVNWQEKSRSHSQQFITYIGR